MALLHANRKNVVESATVDNQPRDQQRDDISEPTAEPTDKAAEQREQEKLRNEVVGRIEPKIAFSDETKDITSGVLPTTIRRNSPAGSLSSIDSLDSVPEDEVETMPASTRNPIAGIIRKRSKVKTDSRVTFNENVAFSDGVVGTLKRKQGIESVVDSSVVQKQKSYFGLSDMGNESKPKTNGTGLESSKDSLILNQYASRQFQSNVPPSSPHDYPHVNPLDIGTTGVMTYSMSNNNNLQSGKNLTPTTTEPKTNALHVLPSSPIVNGLSYAGYTKSSQTGSTTINNNSEKNQTWKMDSTSQSVNGKNYVGHTNHMTTFHTDSVSKNNSFQESSAFQNKTQVNGNDAHNHTDVNKKFNERPSLSFSSINASMLKDSLEMHSGMRISQSDQYIAAQQTQQSKVEFRPPNPENSSSGYVGKHSEIPPETPLIPVTKRDFLSKALRSDSNGVPDGKIEESTYRYSRGNSVSKSEREAPVGGYSMYNQENDVRQNKQIILENNNSYNQKQMVSNSDVTSMTPSAHNDKYNRDRKIQNFPDDSYSEKHGTNNREVRDIMGYTCTTASTPYYTSSSGHVNSSLNQGHQVMSRDNHEIPRPHRTNDEKLLAATPSKSRTETTEKLSATHNTLGTTDTVSQPPDRPILGDGQPSSADELLKSVQENIERLSMTPLQQGTSKTSSSRVKLSGTYSAVPYKTKTSEGRHNRTFSDSGRRPKPFNTTDTSPSFDSKGSLKATANGRKISSRRETSNGQRSKVEKEKKVSETSKRFHRSGSDSAIANQRSGVNMVYGTVQNNNHEIAAGKNYERNQSTRPNQVYTSPNHKTDYQSASHRMHSVSSEARGLQPQPNAFERKQRKNSGGLGYLDKTPTDEEINHLWETVRTCLKHEQPQKAASDSIVNNVRYSRSDSGPLVGNHYLIDGNAWAVKPAGGSDNETRHSRGTATTHFRRQGSLDSLQRRGSTESAGHIPLRKGSLLQHRSSTSERRLTSRNSPGARPPINPQYLQSLRGPLTSSRGPVKSNTVKTEGRPQLSYAEFQAVMQASSDIKTRNTEGDSQKSSRQNVHQPIIMNYRKGKLN